LNIGYDNKLIEEVEAYKLLGLQYGNTLDWKGQVHCIIPKLSSACFTMMAVTQLMKINMLTLVYFSYFHPIISYGLNLLGKFDSNKVFKIN
jgi:hypothetical protein